MKVNVKKACEITDAKISFVSLVDKAANKRQFLITKAENGMADWKTVGKIIKAENHYVTGVVYEPLVEDAHGDFMTAEEIQKAAYWFAKNGNDVDIQHNFVAQDGISVVENWVAKADFDVNGEVIKKGTWLITAEVTDNEVWNKIQKGEITGFSMGGQGKYSEEDIDLDNLKKEEKSVLKKLIAAMSFSRSKSDPLEKAGKKMSGKNKETLCSIYENLGAFLKEFDDPEIPESNEAESINKKEENEMTKDEIQKFIQDSIAKTLENKSAESAPAPAPAEQITPEAISKMVQDAIAKASAPKQEPVSMEQVQKMITDAVEKAMEPIRKQAGIPTNLNDSGQIEKQEDDHYLKGIL